MILRKDNNANLTDKQMLFSEVIKNPGSYVHINLWSLKYSPIDIR